MFMMLKVGEWIALTWIPLLFLVSIKEESLFLGRSDAGELQVIESILRQSIADNPPQRLLVEEKEWIHPETALHSANTINQQQHQQQCKRFLSKTAFLQGSNETETTTMLLPPLRSVARYVPSTEPPRYNYQCFAMKARYNCEQPRPDGATTSTPQQKKGEKATDWKLVLQDPTAVNAPVCDIRSVVDGAGGPSGVANAVRQRRQAFTKGKGDRPVNIVLLGNSYLRQIFEAFACLFQDQITGGFFTDGGPKASREAVKARGSRRLVPKEDAGTIVAMSLINQSDTANVPCQGASQEFANFYHQGVPLHPRRLSKECSDAASMVELGGQLRIWYHFNPSLTYRDTVELMQHFGLDASTIDALVANKQYEQLLHQLQPHLARDVYASAHNWDHVLPQLKDIQANDTGRYFGADNPYIWTPPDDHPCMPGMPDDEAYLLLLSLLLDARVW